MQPNKNTKLFTGSKIYKFLKSNNILYYLLLTIVPLLLCIDRINLRIDDTYISLRYVWNIINGNGAVFNISERLEVISNPTWCWFLSGVFYLFKVKDLFLIIYLAKFIGVFFLILTGIFLFRLLNSLNGDKLNSLFFTLIFILNPFVASYSASGLENSFIYFLFVICLIFVYNYLKSRKDFYLINIGIFTGILAISRPEAIIYGLGIYAVLFYFSLKNNKEIKRVKLLFSFGIFALINIAMIIWRYMYYGDIFSNTVYAKNYFDFSVLSNGIRYTINFLIYSLSAYIFIFVLVKKNLIKKLSINKKIFISIIFLIIIIHSLFIFYTGGDWMPGYRLLLILLICFAIIFSIISKDYILQFDNKKMFYTILSICLIFTIVSGRNEIRNYNPIDSGLNIRNWSFIPKSYLDLANKLKEISSPGEKVLIGEAGLIPFLNPQLKFVDIYGLMDRHIAKQLKGKHFERSDSDYLISLNCDYYIYIGSNKELIDNIKANNYYPQLSSGQKPIDDFIYNPEFKERYVPVYFNENGVIFKNSLKGK